MSSHSFRYYEFTFIPLIGSGAAYARPAAYFALGILFWLNRDFIPLHPVLAGLGLVALYFASDNVFFRPVFALTFTYWLFYLAYQTPQLRIDRFGDISFGIYLYAWPLQQVVYWQGQSGYTNAALATIATFFAACFSWFLVEKPMISHGHGVATSAEPKLADAALFLTRLKNRWARK